MQAGFRTWLFTISALLLHCNLKAQDIHLPGPASAHKMPVNIQSVHFDEKTQLYEVTYSDKGKERIFIYNKSHSIQEIRQVIVYNALPAPVKEYMAHQHIKPLKIYECTFPDNEIHYMIEANNRYIIFNKKGEYIANRAK